MCQICGRASHAAIRCYHRFDINFHGNQQSSGFSNGSNGQQGSHQAYVNQVDVATSSGAGTNGSDDQNWYVDNGATNHVTISLQNLSPIGTTNEKAN